MALSFSSSIFLLSSAVFVFAHASQSSLPDGMHRGMYCIGCETTVKVLDRFLRGVTKDQLDLTVPEVLDTVCEPENLDLNEYDKNFLSKACNHIVNEHATMMEAVLMSHYGRSNRPSYYDLVQQICQDVTKACAGVSHEGHDHDPLRDDAKVVLDRDKNDFVVLPGKNLKVPKPVSESHEEL